MSVSGILYIKLNGQKHVIKYQDGDTILEASLRAGLRAPFSCRAGTCATCMAVIIEGSVDMRTNKVLTAEEVAEGNILTCQAVPSSAAVEVDYDA